MSQAKVLSEKDVRRVLLNIATKRHAVRNRAMFLVLQFSGMRVKELASLKIADVLDSEGQIKNEIYLSAEQTKGSSSRTVFLSTKAQDEIKTYLQHRFGVKDLLAVTFTDTSRALFNNQKGYDGFSASTLAQHFHYMYKSAQIDGASSHSSRRTFLTKLANKNVSVRVLMQIAGHKSLAVTQKYLDCNATQIHESVNLI